MMRRRRGGETILPAARWPSAQTEEQQYRQSSAALLLRRKIYRYAVMMKKLDGFSRLPECSSDDTDFSGESSAEDTPDECRRMPTESPPSPRTFHRNIDEPIVKEKTQRRGDLRCRRHYGLRP